MLTFFTDSLIELQLEDRRQHATKAISEFQLGSKMLNSINYAPHKAAMNGQSKIVTELLGEPGVDIDFRVDEYFGQTALHAACDKGRFGVVERLVQHGVEALFMQASSTTGNTRAPMLAIALLDQVPQQHLGKQLSNGSLILNLAIEARNETIVRNLLDDRVVSLQQRDSTPMVGSPLGSLCIYGSDTDEIIEIVVSSSKDLSVRSDEGLGLLHLAS